MVGLTKDAVVTNVGYVNTYVIENLGVGIHQFAIQTLDTDGILGNWSNIIEVGIEGPSRPGGATGLAFNQ